ncbi:hypothetical protein [Algoriphagus aquaeductus]|nr:hypothetical protein [Algoriphagus aquaeductus]
MRKGQLHFNYQFDSPSTMEGVSKYINPVTTNLLFKDFSEEAPDESEKIGEIVFDRVFTDHIILDEKYTVFDVFDEDSDFYATYGFKITNGYEYHKSLKNRWKDLGYGETNFIYIYEYWLKPEFRGQKIMLKAILDLIDQFQRGISLFVIMIKPVLESEILRYPEVNYEIEKHPIRKYDEALSEQKLMNHLSEIGFEKIEGFSDLMFLNPSELDFEVYEQFELSKRIEIV